MSDLPRKLQMSEGELRAEAVRRRAERREYLFQRGMYPDFNTNRQHVYLDGYYTWEDIRAIFEDHRLDAGEDDDGCRCEWCVARAVRP